MKVIELYRVSTQRQGFSGLGLEAQQREVLEYINQVAATSIAKFVEIESGGNKDRISCDKAPVLSTLLSKRPKLHEAIKLSIATGATILVKDLSRLTRYSLLMNYIVASGAKFICVNAPTDDMTILRIKCALAEDELIKISQRTKAALKSKKLQGVQLGNPTNLNDADRLKGRVAHRSAAIQANMQVIDIIETQREKGTTYEKIADKLNSLGYKTSRGNSFSKGTIKIMYDRYRGCLTD